MRRKKNPRDPRSVEPAPVLIVTALSDLEEPALVEQLELAGASAIQQTSQEHKYQLKRWFLPMQRRERIAVLTKCLEVSGNGLAGLEVARVLRIVRPQFILFCGIGGSLSPKDAWYGSVVCSTVVCWGGFDKVETGPDGALVFREKTIHTHTLSRSLSDRIGVFRNRFFPVSTRTGRAHLVVSSPNQSAIIRWLANEKIDAAKHSDLLAGYFSLHTGHIYSWDLVINSEKKRDAIHTANSNYRCVDMESGAVTYAVDNLLNDNQKHATKFIAFRGISDLSADKVETPWRGYAASAAAFAAVQFVRTLTPTDFT